MEWRIRKRNEGNDGNVGNQGGNAGNQGGNEGNQGGNAEDQGGNPGNQGGNAGNWGENAGNQGGNAGNQGDSLRESLCLLVPLKSWSARGVLHHPAFWTAAQLLVTRFLPCLPSG